MLRDASRRGVRAPKSSNAHLTLRSSRENNSTFRDSHMETAQAEQESEIPGQNRFENRFEWKL